MRRISKSRVAKAKRLTERYADCHGIPFDEYPFALPVEVSDWPQILRVDDSQVCEKMHEWFWFCWACGGRDVFGGYFPEYKLEVHHIVGGTKGRSDEFANVSLLCGKCHSGANTDALPLGRILFLKWKHDRQHCDWVRLALLRRCHLPDLITD